MNKGMGIPQTGVRRLVEWGGYTLFWSRQKPSRAWQ
jgi:hypothetical protein